MPLNRRRPDGTLTSLFILFVVVAMLRYPPVECGRCGFWVMLTMTSAAAIRSV
jgi:hypothetical protein